MNTLKRAQPGSLLVPALAISRLGDQVFALAFPWLVYNLDPSPMAQGLQYAGLYLPFMLLPLIGVWVDRVHRGRLLILSDLTRLCLLLGAVWLQLPLLGLVALVVTLSFFDQVFEVGLEASTPDLYGGAVARVNVQMSTVGAVARLVGPAVAAALLTVVGPRGLSDSTD